VTIGLIDNDILLKLTAFQLIDETIDLLGLSINTLRVLSTAEFVFRNWQKKQQVQPDKSQGYTDNIWEEAILFCQLCQPLNSLNSTLESSILNEIQQLMLFREEINEGETELILATAYTADFVILTGDKRCLQALPQIPLSIYSRLQGRVLCLEQIILKLIDRLGFDQVQSLIQPAIQCDKSIRICFGYSQPAPENQVRAALQNYIDDINHLAPGLLADLG
jgi:hypothetical protein